jgi:hypothetical protein
MSNFSYPLNLVSARTISFHNAIIGKSLFYIILGNNMKSISIYCGSSDEVDQVYLDAAFQMGAVIAQRGIRVVYGGGGTGLMGAVANGALTAGGEVIGVIPEIFNTVEMVHDRLTRTDVVGDMHQRKARMAELAEGFVAMPGGFGTLEELFEVLTWSQIGLHEKPIGLLNTNQYFDRLVSFLEHVEEQGFTFSRLHELYSLGTTPSAVLNALINKQPNNNLEQ